jgi:catechol 2,3-dioxygenase-like lactoylglutathione lyase family enzyme
MSEKVFSGFHHYGVYCPNLEESIAFYRDGMGFEFLNYFEDRDEIDHFKMAFLKLDKFLLELSEPLTWESKALEWSSMGPNHFCLVCGDVEAMKAKLDADFDVEWIVMEDNPYYKSALLRGPGNELIELMQVTNDAFPTVHTPNDTPYVRGIGHFGYFCEDLDRSVEFYTDLFSFKHKLTFESRGSILDDPYRAAMLTLNDTMIELVQPDSNPVVLDMLKYLARMNMDHLGMIPEGDMQAAINYIQARTYDVIWENAVPNITPDVMEGISMQWALFRGPNGERWEFGKDV